tara:strand:+ start:1102 stop:1656 length:555 start_codon:yes stop_codon:yes gene_type:complete
MATQGDKKVFGVYIPSVLNSKVIMSINEIGRNIKQNLEKMIQFNTEGKCIPDGFIRPNSVKILSYSSGNVCNENVEFQVVYECMICHPVEGMIIDNCVVRTITKAGIHAEVVDDNGAVPITIFIARDHHFSDSKFSKIKVDDKIKVTVIGSRFELNDKYISVIANIMYDKEKKPEKKQVPINII